MCLSEINLFTMSLKLLLIALVLESKLMGCDRLMNITHNENFTSPLVQCNRNDSDSAENCKSIMRDRHVVIVKPIDNYLSDSNSRKSTYSDRLKYSSILYGIVLLAQENELNQKCYNEIMQIYDGITRKEIWAIKSELQHIHTFVSEFMSFYYHFDISLLSRPLFQKIMRSVVQ
jgi:hypothetical protein